jgi:hypothetical protein
MAYSTLQLISDCCCFRTVHSPEIKILFALAGICVVFSLLVLVLMNGRRFCQNLNLDMVTMDIVLDSDDAFINLNRCTMDLLDAAKSFTVNHEDEPQL